MLLLEHDKENERGDRLGRDIYYAVRRSRMLLESVKV